MRDISLSNKDDLKITPPETLKRETLAVMESFGNSKEIDAPVKHRSVKRTILLCAIIMCVLLALITAAVQVFDYLVYIPGMGLVEANSAEVYTLKERTRVGWFHIEAMSFIPVTEGEHAGEWIVTLIVDKDIAGDMWNDPQKTAPIYLTGKDDVKYALNPIKIGSSSDFTRYQGYAIVDGAGDYTLTWDEKNYTATMRSIDDTEWANYSYPAKDGITVIAFPMADYSPYVIFDVILDPICEDLMYWAKYSSIVYYSKEGMRVTDTLGNIYYSHSTRGGCLRIPESEKESGIYGSLEFIQETIMFLDRPLEAPVAKIEFDGVEISFEFMKNTPDSCTITVPELGGTIAGEELPNGGLLIDEHGIKLRAQSIQTIINEDTGYYDLFITTDLPEPAFDMPLSKLHVEFEFGAKKYPIEERKYGNRTSAIYWSDWFEERGEPIAYHHCKILGSGGLSTEKVLDVTYGEEVVIRVNRVALTVEGEWVIDFTADK